MGNHTVANVTERRFAPPSLAISTVIFALKDGRSGKPTLWLPLVRRVREPYKGQWALPGGPLGFDESLESAALRNLSETAGVNPEYVEQLYAFGGVDRARNVQRELVPRVVSIVYWALVRSSAIPEDPQLENVQWFPVDQVPELAFDHQEIVDYALWRLRNKIEYGSIAYRFLGERFTLAQLQSVYEAVLGKELDAANFRRALKAAVDIEATEEYLQGGKHRPPRLYRYNGRG